MTTRSLSVQCPSCEATFAIDPLRVPREGIPVICSDCLRVFRIELPLALVRGEGMDATSSEDAGATDPPPEEPEFAGEPASRAVEDPALAAEEFGVPPAQVAEEAAEVGSSRSGRPPEEPAVEGTLSAAAARFGRRSPSDRARRLARVLVSDMITYHPARYEEARESGTLVQAFEEEIEKSWEEYVEQVGPELAEGTDFFIAALNDILARGETLFRGTGRPG
ncbi:MAG: hypothetical protein EA352_08860 [Gemmatimonadales bacterium]|nr:MAG: hypothetical protein EA352_08860 [Gemmatimonadales bacterium]